MINRELLRGEATLIGTAFGRRPYKWSGKENVLLAGCFRGKGLSMIGKELQGGMFCTYFALNNYARIHYCL
jgi:hypothetical protein